MVLSRTVKAGLKSVKFIMSWQSIFAKMGGALMFSMIPFGGKIIGRRLLHIELNVLIF